MSATEARKRAGIANITLTKILSDASYEPPAKVVGKLAAALRVEPQELLAETVEIQDAYPLREKPKKIKVAVRKYTRNNDVIGEFLNDVCIKTGVGNDRIATSKLYKAFCEYCARKNIKNDNTRSNQAFVKELRTKSLVNRDRKLGNCIMGFIFKD